MLNNHMADASTGDALEGTQVPWTSHLSLADLVSLPPTLSVTEADCILGIGQTLAKRLRREGSYPVRLLPSLGRRHRVSTAELLEYLGCGWQGHGSSPASDGTLQTSDPQAALREAS